MLPILLDALEIVPKNLWQFSCMLSAIAIGLLVIGSARARLSMKGAQQAGVSQTVFATNFAFGLVSLAVQLFGTAGIVAGRGAYFVGLFYLQYGMFAVYYRTIVMADEAARRGAATAS